MDKNPSTHSNASNSGKPHMPLNLIQCTQENFEDAQFMEDIRKACKSLGLSGTDSNQLLQMKFGPASVSQTESIFGEMKAKHEDQLASKCGKCNCVCDNVYCSMKDGVITSSKPNPIKVMNHIVCSNLSKNIIKDNSECNLSSDNKLANVLERKLEEKSKEVESLKEKVVRLEDELSHLWSFFPDYHKPIEPSRFFSLAKQEPE